jgi:osmoprotectant transport system ATP-binding protein
VLLDEPFGALDPITRDALARAYRNLHDRFGLTTVMVTHDLNEALLLVDRLGVMRDGALVALGSPSHLLGEVTEPYVESLMSVPRRQAASLAQKFGAWRSSSLG